jgi:hypothetical protein
MVLFGVGLDVYAVVNFWLLVRPPRTVSPTVLRWAAGLSSAGLVLLVLVPALVTDSSSSINAWDQAGVVAAMVVASVTWLGVHLGLE